MKYFPALCIGVLLAWTFHLYGSATFYTDDFNNLYWTQRESGPQLVLDIVNPASKMFRPVGLAVYWLLLHFAGLNMVAYHVVAWLLHAGNTALLYLIVKRITGARAGAVIGTMVFASHAAFADIYWSFGTIFELVSAAAIFGSILFWIREKRSWGHAILLTLVYLLAIKAKETALVLPAIWLLCDLLVRRKITLRLVAQVLPAAALGCWYGLTKSAAMRETGPQQLYFMDIRWITLGRGYGGYFNSFFSLGFRWQIWSIGFVALLILFIWRRNRAALFFQAYILITFLPVIFLVNHRESYLWYIPSLGVCGLIALLTGAITNFGERWVPSRTVTAAGYVLLPFLCVGTYFLQKHGSVERRTWQMPMSSQYRAFVLGLRSIPPPPPGETLYFDSHPIYFSEEMLRTATQVALRRTDVEARLVPEFPAESRYRLHFQDSKLTQVP